MHTIFEHPDYPALQVVLFLIQFYFIGISAMLTIKLKRNKLIAFISIPIFWYVSLFPLHFTDIPRWTNAIILVFICLWIFIMCKGTILAKLVSTTLLIISVFILSDLILVLIFNSLIQQEKLAELIITPKTFFILALINAMFCLIYILIYNKLTTRNSNKKSNASYLIPLWVLVTIQILFIVTIEIVANLFANIPAERLLVSLQTLLYIFGVAFIISDIIVYRSAKSNARLQQLQADYKILEYQNNLQTEYYEKMQKNIDSTSKIRHDINNLVQVINIQLAENTSESRAKASEIANEIRNVMLTTRTQKYCDNRLVNTILFDKTALAAENGIKISDEIILDERTGIDNFDLCRIFVNLLDNAINALKKYDGTNNKTVFISCKQSDGFLYIKSENPYTPTTEKKAKKDKDKLHGYGLKIVDDIVKKYNGIMTKNADNGSYSVLVVLKLNNIENNHQL